VIWRRAQRSAAGQLLHTTHSSSGIGMAAVCSPKVADLWLPHAPLSPYLRKVNGARKARSQEQGLRGTRLATEV
jgi:hypothetical protein